MNNTDTPTTPAGPGAGTGLDKAQELHTPASGVPIPSTDVGDNLTSPRVIERDAAFYKKREETLRTTGEILHERCVDKLERLNQLREEVAKKQQSTIPPLRNATSLQDQQLAILRMEEARLKAEQQKIRANRNVFPEVLPEVNKLRVRQSVHDSIHEYAIMLPHLKQELEETQAELTGEKQLLKELKEIRRALQARRQDLATTGDSVANQQSSQGRTKMMETKVLVQELMRELTKFLARYYPPIQPYDDDTTVYDLKQVLEDIMNLSVSRPADPYLVLVPGEYYPPHVEQLINAGVAVRHPRDSQRLRLIDFYS
ncbi:hypothetical protein BG015_011251 [Linnemannia schmuckeri]|uniref:Centromere protein K n=1 Tax=Linnemannia schmuckeri TaxID=64567 RepID=A0A9P5V8B2_9FUNG|nr:hypothetical protein BG015_011251 [Linnemannia schmuckeri]